MDGARGPCRGHRHLPGNGRVLRLSGTAPRRGTDRDRGGSGGVQYRRGTEISRGGAAGAAAAGQGPADQLRGPARMTAALLNVGEEVAAALQAGRPVVALESTLI